MGSGASINSKSSAIDVATCIRNIGVAYENYAIAIEENGLDGATISNYSPSELEELLNDLDVTKGLHRKRLTTEFKNFGIQNQKQSIDTTDIPINGTADTNNNVVKEESDEKVAANASVSASTTTATTTAPETKIEDENNEEHDIANQEV